jgi:hypothetical protein
MFKKFMRRSFQCLISVLCLTSLDTQARISPLAFHDITKHFNEGYEYNSPVLGMTALESGLIPNLRFYGNYKAGHRSKEDQTRAYIKDSGNDKVWALLKELFPSSGGTLTVETKLPSNFGRNASIKSVALLLTFSHDVRNPKNSTLKKLTGGERVKLTEAYATREKLEAIDKNKITEKQTKELEALHEKYKTEFQEIGDDQLKKEKEHQIFKSMPILEWQEKDNKKQRDKDKQRRTKELKKNIYRILKAIEGAIQEEKKGFYPKYTTEQIILAFFCEKFNTRKELIDFIKELRDINPKIVSKFDDSLDPNQLLTTEDIKNDDFYNLANAYIFTAPTPYKPGGYPLSNGNTWIYDREADKLLQEDTFADCVEIAIRHAFNLITYDQLKREFNLIFAQKNNAENPYFKNFEGFYKAQKPFSANDGSILMRSNWNKVVGDLNKDNGPKVTYLNKKGKAEYELETGFINLIRVCQKLFNLQLPDKEKELEKLDVTGAKEDQQKKWVEEHLKALFIALNPNREYKIDTSNLKRKENAKGVFDLFGDLPITVSENEENLFSFVFYLSEGHGKIHSLKLLQEENKKNYSTIFKKIASPFKDNTSLQSLNLVASLPSDIPLYNIFSQNLADNDSRVGALKRILNKEDKALKITLAHILDATSWDDEYVVKKITPLVFKLNEFYKDVLGKHVKGLCFGFQYKLNDENLKNIVNFKNLTDLDLNSCNQIEDISPLQSLINLTYLDLSSCEKIKNISPLQSLINLTYLNLSACNQIEDISALKDLTNLKELHLSSCNQIEDISSLKDLTNLKELHLSWCKKLADISPLQGLINLRLLYLRYCENIKDISSLQNLKNLEELNLRYCKNIKDISPLKNLKNLNELFLERCEEIADISPLQNLKNLKKLYLRYCKNIKDISPLQELKNLNELYLEGCQQIGDEDIKSLEREGLTIER